MNCAPIKISSGTTRKRRRRSSSDFASLPFVWKANLAGLNDCNTIEGEDPVYPDPGTDVLYGGDMSESSTATPGTCDSPTPYGQTYKGSAIDSSDSSSGATSEASSTYEDSSGTTEGHPETTVATPQVDYVSTQTLSTPTTTPTTIENAPATFSFSPLPSGTPPYASSNTTAYLPCVPDTFLCTNATTFLTCVASDSYLYPLPVAAGMQCLPSYSTDVSNGLYRDDEIVRARPDGGCDVEGSMLCTDGGNQFEVCEDGGWVDMGNVAAGTVCEDGKIVAAE